MIKVIRTFEEVETIREDWQKLFLEAQHVTPFQSYAFTEATLKFLGEAIRQLYIICVIRQKDKFVQAIFPCYIDKNGALRFINDRDSDFCGPIIHQDFVCDYHVYEEFSNHVKGQKDIRHVRFENLVTQSATLGFLRYFFTGAVVYNNNTYSIVSVDKLETQPKGAIDCIASLNSKEKYRLINVQKKMDGESLRVYENSNGDDYPTEIVNTLIDGMVARGIRNKEYFNDDFLELFKNLFDAGLLQVAVTMKGNEPIAANICLKMGKNEVIDWIAIYSERHYNLHNLLQIISRIAEEGGKLNFARGTYEYKIHNFRPIIYNLYSLRYSPTTLGTLNDIRHVSWHFFRKLVKRIITKK